MPILQADTPDGYELPEVACQFSLEHFQRGSGPNIHTDVEAARREGLSAPVATGPQVAALTFRQLRDAFGRGWIVGGKCELTFRKPVPVDAFCVARAVVTGREQVTEGVRINCDVWIENLAHDKLIVGTASGVVEHGRAAA